MSWVDVFGKVSMLPLGTPDGMNQFQIYERVSRNYDHTFLLESLAGPEVLAETSVMGFDPAAIFRAYTDRVEIIQRHNCKDNAAAPGTTIIKTQSPFDVLRSLLADAASVHQVSAYHDHNHDVKDSMAKTSQMQDHNCAGMAHDNSKHATVPNDSDKKSDIHDTQKKDAYRYVGGAVGMINYDAIRTIEKIPDSNGSDSMIMEFGIYTDGIMYDHKANKPSYFYRGGPCRLKEIQAILLSSDQKTDAAQGMGADSKFYASMPAANIEKSRFTEIVERAKRYIVDGDIFQVVLSRRFGFETRGSTISLYRVLRNLNPSPYMYHIRHAGNVAIGASPEMLVRITDDTVETFPIAGTRHVTGDESRDEMLAEELLSDEKELAEHTMLVDLGRNDIGRVCKPGTVRPESLMKIRKFSHVQHIVTHLKGTLRSDVDMFDAFQSVFPAGTVTGAPKIRAMEIIDDLEPAARGPYAGAAGYFSFNGCCDFAIAIRSIFINGQRGFVQSGAGIVYDSIPEREFEETRHKADAMLQALEEASS